MYVELMFLLMAGLTGVILGVVGTLGVRRIRGGAETNGEIDGTHSQIGVAPLPNAENHNTLVARTGAKQKSCRPRKQCETQQPADIAVKKRRGRPTNAELAKRACEAGKLPIVMVTPEQLKAIASMPTVTKTITRSKSKAK